MYCIYTLTVASMKMFLRNRQALFFSLFMPMLILFIFGSMGFDSPGRIRIGLVTHAPAPETAQFVKQLSSFEAFNVRSGTLDEELGELKAGNRAVVLDVPDDLL